MKQFKLVKLLQLLNEKEFQRLYKYLRSPYFNYTRAIVAYYEAIRRYHPSFDSGRLVPKRIWGKIFPDEPYHEQKFWRLSSDFAILVKKYLAQLQIEKTDGESQRFYIKALGDRNGYALFEKETQDALAGLEKQPFRDTDYFNRKTDLHFDYYFHPLTPKHTLEDDSLMELIRNMDHEYALAKFRVSCILKNREALFRKKYPSVLLDAVKKVAAEGLLKDNVLFKMYGMMLELDAVQSGHALFFQLKNYFLGVHQKVKRLDQVIIHSIMINYSVRQINVGNSSFYKEALEMYKFGLDNLLIMEKEKISEAVFGNVVILGCSAGEMEWVGGFIESYSPYLDAQIKEETVVYSEATLAYFQGKFETAIALLSQYSFPAYHQVKVRMLSIRSGFELFVKNSEFFYFVNSQMNSFEKFLRRDELRGNSNKEASLNFIKLTKKLLLLRLENKKRDAFLKLEKEVEKEPSVVLKKWLLEKINLLSG